MRLIHCFFALAGCWGTSPGKVVNPQVPTRDLPTEASQLVYQTDDGVRVHDLETHSTFALGPAKFHLADMSDDTSVIVLVEPNDPTLAVLRAGKAPAFVTLAAYPQSIDVSPDGKHIAGTYASSATAFATDELFVIDVDTLVRSSIPAARKSHNVKPAGTGWLRDSSAFVVAMDDDTTLALLVASGQREPTTAAPWRSKWQLAQAAGGGPDACTRSSGETISGDYRRLADIRGIAIRPPQVNPVRSWGFFPDCALHVVHDGTLWIVDNQRNASSLGSVSIGSRPVVFPAKTFAPS